MQTIDQLKTEIQKNQRIIDLSLRNDFLEKAYNEVNEENEAIREKNNEFVDFVGGHIQKCVCNKNPQCEKCKGTGYIIIDNKKGN